MLPEEQVEFNKIGDQVSFFIQEGGDAIVCIAKDKISLPRTELLSQGLGIDQQIISQISNIKCSFLFKQHLIVGTEYEVKLYCIKPWKDKKTIFQSSDLIRAVCLQNDGYVAIGTDNSEIEMFNISNPPYSYQLKGHKNSVTGLWFSPDGQTLMSSSCDGTMRIWAKSLRHEGWDCVHSLTTIIKKFQPEDVRFPFSWNPTGLFGCVYNCDGDIEVLENITWDTKLKIKTQGEVSAIEFSPNGLYVVLLEEKVVSCWKVFDGRPKLVQRQKHAEKLVGIHWHPKKNDLILVPLIN